MERLMQYRFQGDSPLAGHCFGNLFIAAMAQAEGGMEAGLNATSQILKVRGRVIPSTLEDIRLQARMTDGSIVTGESEIPKVRKHIKKMMMLPADAQAANGAIDAILNADVLISDREVCIPVLFLTFWLRESVMLLYGRRQSKFTSAML